MTTTNLTEMAEFFPTTSKPQEAPKVVRGVAPRFWLPGDTYEQALGRQQANLDRIKASIAKAEGR